MNKPSPPVAEYRDFFVKMMSKFENNNFFHKWTEKIIMTNYFVKKGKK